MCSTLPPVLHVVLSGYVRVGYDHPVSASAGPRRALWVWFREHWWPYHTRHSDFLKPICNYSGTMRWSIIINEQKVEGVRDWAIHNNQICFALTGDVCLTVAPPPLKRILGTMLTLANRSLCLFQQHWRPSILFKVTRDSSVKRQ